MKSKEDLELELKFLRMLESSHSAKERLEAIRMRIHFVENQMEMQEIETKQMSILEIKRIRQGLSQEEKSIHKKLNEKWRDEKGKLREGSYFINSNSEWERISQKRF